MLTVEQLSTGYGSRDVVYDVSLRVDEGEVVALIGHNGAGKTTTLKSVAGLLPTWHGRVDFAGQNITRKSAAHNVRQGLCFVPEDRFVFEHLNVDENLTLAGFTIGRDETQRSKADAFELLPVLQERRKQRAGTLSGGERRMLSIGMALMSQPRMLLLDEPSLGLAPVLVEQVMDFVSKLAHDKELSVLMVEQNVEQVLRIASRLYVMRSGRIAAEETAAQAGAREQWWDLF